MIREGHSGGIPNCSYNHDIQVLGVIRMVKHNFSRFIWESLDLLPFLILSPIIILALYALTYIVIKDIPCLGSLINYNCCKKPLTERRCLHSLTSKIVMLVFGPPKAILKYERSNELLKETNNHSTPNNSICIKGKKVEPIYVSVLALYVLVFCCFAIEVFWDIFLIDVSTGTKCNDRTSDCYRENNSNPITDCYLYDSDPSAVFTCYTFSFALGSGLAAVGGLMTVAVFVMKVIAFLFLNMYSVNHCKLSRCQCHCHKHFILFFQYAVVLLGIINFYAVFIVVVTRHSSYSTADVCRSVFIFVTLVVGCAFPWRKFAQGRYVIEQGGGENIPIISENVESPNSYEAAPNA